MMPDIFFKRFKVMMVAVILLYPVDLPADPFPGKTIQGAYLFKSGDNPEWALPEMNDSGWEAVQIPGSWQEQGFKPHKNMGWYRIRFRIPPDLDLKEPGLYLGEIGNADETYLNGRCIGATGAIGNRFVETRSQRLYRIPPGLLTPQKEHCLAIRVLSLEPGSGMISSKPVLGEYPGLLHYKDKKNRRKILEEAVCGTIVLIFCIAACLFYITGSRQKEFICFAGFTLIYLASIICESVLFYELGLKTPWVQAILIGFIPMTLVPLILFLVYFSKHELTTWLKGTILASVLFSVITLFWGNYNYRLFNLLGTAWLIQVMWVAGIGLYLNYHMMSVKIPERRPLFWGSGILILCGMFYLLCGIDLKPLNRCYLLLLAYDDYMLIFFMFCLVHALGLRFSRLQKETRTLSGKILHAHENERKRLARDLHDGLGQRLLAIKFNLQRIQKSLQDPMIPEVLEEIAHSIDDLRQISHGLRPVILDKAGLASAIQSHAAMVDQASAATISTEVGEMLRAPPVVEDNLFRIFQEALGNALKHAGATRIDVMLRQKGTILEMGIRDNGSGYSSDGQQPGGRGIGISTIKERVSLLNGNLRIRSREKHGTDVHIRIDLEEI